MGTTALTTPADAAMLDVEKDELTVGFIKLTDMAPLAIAYEMGFFEDEGLFVTLEAQANWKVLLDRVIDVHVSFWIEVVIESPWQSSHRHQQMSK